MSHLYADLRQRLHIGRRVRNALLGYLDLFGIYRDHVANIAVRIRDTSNAHAECGAAIARAERAEQELAILTARYVWSGQADYGECAARSEDALVEVEDEDDGDDEPTGHDDDEEEGEPCNWDWLPIRACNALTEASFGKLGGPICYARNSDRFWVSDGFAIIDILDDSRVGIPLGQDITRQLRRLLSAANEARALTLGKPFLDGSTVYVDAPGSDGDYRYAIALRYVELVTRIHGAVTWRRGDEAQCYAFAGGRCVAVVMNARLGIPSKEAAP